MLFISKEVTQPDFLAYVKAGNISMVDVSMISFIEVAFDCPKPTYEVVFFSSPRAASFFLKRCTVSSNIAIATIGKATTRFLEDYGYTVSFTGSKSGIPDFIGKEFKAFVGGRKVLFPQSNFSQRSMQKHLTNQQIIDLVVYKTELTPVLLDEKPTVLVFTSPTNVQSFLKLNAITADQKIIAWGKTTAEFLKKNDTRVDFTLQYSSFEELKMVLEQHFFPI